MAVGIITLLFTLTMCGSALSSTIGPCMSMSPLAPLQVLLPLVMITMWIWLPQPGTPQTRRCPLFPPSRNGLVNRMIGPKWPITVPGFPPKVLLLLTSNSRLTWLLHVLIMQPHKL